MWSPKNRMPSVSSPLYTGCVIRLSWKTMLPPRSFAPMESAWSEVKPWTTTLLALTSMPCTVVVPPPE